MEKEDEVQQRGREVYTFWCVRWAAQERDKIELLVCVCVGSPFGR